MPPRANSLSVHPIVSQIIDRDCHVSMSHRAVIRHVISRLKLGHKSFRAMAPEDRRLLMQQCIYQHTENWRLYVAVMGGSLDIKSKPISKPDELAEKLSGREVCRLMRKHKKTISGLSFRLGVSIKQVRQARADGLVCPLTVRDWYEAITGTDPGPIPTSFRINRHPEEAACCNCGCPLYVGDTAFDYLNEVFCSRTCCRQSRGWSEQ